MRGIPWLFSSQGCISYITPVSIHVTAWISACCYEGCAVFQTLWFGHHQLHDTCCHCARLFALCSGANCFCWSLPHSSLFNSHHMPWGRQPMAALIWHCFMALPCALCHLMAVAFFTLCFTALCAPNHGRSSAALLASCCTFWLCTMLTSHDHCHIQACRHTALAAFLPRSG